MADIKNDIIRIGKWVWEKDLTAGLSGNISAKVSRDEILITSHGAFLGELKEKDLGKVDSEGRSRAGGFAPSTETPFHTSVYKALDTKVIIHVHPTFTNGFFAVRDTITFDTFETRLTLGDIPVIDQKTPAITDISPVVEALKKSNIVVLKHHGVVAIGDNLEDTFFLVQTLEEAVKMACIKDMLTCSRTPSIGSDKVAKHEASLGSKKYKLFSDEQIQEIVRLVNADDKFNQLAKETSLETKLAVVLEETGVTYRFNFSQGQIKDYSHSAQDAEFVISGKADYWRAIFNRQLDPFAATTQKKLKLKGDFAKISRWFVPFNRLFELWTGVPVE